MEQKKQNKKLHHLSLMASDAELEKFDKVKHFHARNSDSDTLRFLINQEAQRIEREELSCTK